MPKLEDITYVNPDAVGLEAIRRYREACVACDAARERHKAASAVAREAVVAFDKAGEEVGEAQRMLLIIAAGEQR